MTVTYFSAHRPLELKSDRIENNSHHCAQRTLHPFCVVSNSCMVAEPVFLEWDIDIFLILWYWDIEWRWHLLKKSRCWDVSLTSSRHRWWKYVNSHQALRWTQQCRDSRKLWERWDSRCRNRAQKTWVGKPEPYAPGKHFDDWDFTFNGHAGTLDPAYPASAENSETITNSGGGDSTTRTAISNLAVLTHDAHTERST